MDHSPSPEEFYAKLKQQLEETSDWPTEYLYKFIIATNEEKITEIEDIFNNMGAVIENKKSKNGNYTSMSINVRMKDPESVIEKYKEVGKKVKGVISL